MLLLPLLALLGSTIAVCDSPDPLFVRMAGDWSGQGEKNYPLSGRVSDVQIRVHSWVDGGILYSDNDVTETPRAGGAPSHYARAYWVRPAAGAAGHYELGSGTVTSGLAGATGGFTEQTGGAPSCFEVTQDLGGDYVIRSRTEFPGEDATLYTETGWHGETRISETKLEFRRIPAP